MIEATLPAIIGPPGIRPGLSSDNHQSFGGQQIEIGIKAINGLSENQAISALSKDLRTYQNEFDPRQLSVISQVNLRVGKRKLVKNMLTGRGEVVDTISSEEGEPVEKWTWEGEKNGKIYSEVIDKYRAVASSKSDIAAVWVSTSSEKDHNVGSNNRIYKLEKEGDNVVLTSYTAGGSEESMWNFLDRISDKKHDRSQSLHSQTAFFDPHNKISHQKVYQSLISSLNHQEHAKSSRFLQQFHQELHLSDQERERINKERDKRYAQILEEKKSEKHNLQAAFGLVAQALAATVEKARKKAQDVYFSVQKKFQQTADSINMFPVEIKNIEIKVTERNKQTAYTEDEKAFLAAYERTREEEEEEKRPIARIRQRLTAVKKKIGVEFRQWELQKEKKEEDAIIEGIKKVSQQQATEVENIVTGFSPLAQPTAQSGHRGGNPENVEEEVLTFNQYLQQHDLESHNLSETELTSREIIYAWQTIDTIVTTLQFVYSEETFTTPLQSQEVFAPGMTYLFKDFASLPQRETTADFKSDFSNDSLNNYIDASPLEKHEKNDKHKWEKIMSTLLVVATIYANIEETIGNQNQSETVEHDLRAILALGMVNLLQQLEKTPIAKAEILPLSEIQLNERGETGIYKRKGKEEEDITQSLIRDRINLISETADFLTLRLLEFVEDEKLQLGDKDRIAAGAIEGEKVTFDVQLSSEIVDIARFVYESESRKTQAKLQLTNLLQLKLLIDAIEKDKRPNVMHDYFIALIFQKIEITQRESREIIPPELTARIFALSEIRPAIETKLKDLNEKIITKLQRYGVNIDISNAQEEDFAINFLFTLSINEAQDLRQKEIQSKRPHDQVINIITSFDNEKKKTLRFYLLYLLYLEAKEKKIILNYNKDHDFSFFSNLISALDYNEEEKFTLLTFLNLQTNQLEEIKEKIRLKRKLQINFEGLLHENQAVKQNIYRNSAYFFYLNQNNFKQINEIIIYQYNHLDMLG